MNVAVVVGNPKLGSRTRKAAELVAERLTGAPPDTVLELVELGPALLNWDDPGVTAAKQSVMDADLVIFASPTFKATYTGLLKLFLEQFAAGELHGTSAIALMLGAGPQHGLAGEHMLKPVLSEIGCSCPTPALFLFDSAWESSPELDTWLARAGCHPSLISFSASAIPPPNPSTNLPPNIPLGKDLWGRERGVTIECAPDDAAGEGCLGAGTGGLPGLRG